MTHENKELTQEINADHAEKAMEAHAESIDIDYERTQEALTDMLTNLRHYADAHGLNFFKALDVSYLHYLQEKKEERA